MAEEEKKQEADVETEAPEEEAKPKEGGPKFSIAKIISWLLANLIVIIVTVIITTIISWIFIKSTVSQKSKEAYETAKLDTKPEPYAVFDLGEFKVNTADVDQAHFLRVKIGLAYKATRDNKLQTELVARLSQLRDIVMQILSSKEKTDLDENIERQHLKDEIIKQINIKLNSGQIVDVYFDEFVIS